MQAETGLQAKQPTIMLTIAKNLYDYRELMATLEWKNIAMCYKQASLGIAWAILKLVTRKVMSSPFNSPK
jgi:ABC-type polysaccharide/polyol phosphate export permease